MGALPTYKTAPQVIVTRPLSSEDDVPQETAVSATFDMPMDAATITADHFVVTGQGGGRGGTVVYDPLTKTATFTPDTPFDAGETICVQLTNGVLSLWDLAMEADYNWNFDVTEATEVAVGDPNGVPDAFALHQNYPNPFNAETQIRFSIPEPRRVSLRVYNLTGQQVATLADGAYQAGDHDLIWNATDDAGRPLASGVYFCRLEAGGLSDMKKLILLR